MQMQYKEGTNVYTAGGDNLGSIKRIVMNPRTQQVTHLVVEKGFFFPEDRIVPVSWVVQADENRVELGQSVNADELPLFEEEYYIPYEDMAEADPKKYASSSAYSRVHTAPYLYYGPIGAWWSYPGIYGDDDPYYVQEERTNIPEGTLALKTGANVMSHDGKHVGNVEQVFTNSDNDRASHFLISKGLFFKAHKLVPTYWIEETDTNQVRLAVTAQTLNDLPEYEENRS